MWLLRIAQAGPGGLVDLGELAAEQGNLALARLVTEAATGREDLTGELRLRIDELIAPVPLPESERQVLTVLGRIEAAAAEAELLAADTLRTPLDGSQRLMLAHTIADAG